jgi:MoaE-MoaD fusion protein
VNGKLPGGSSGGRSAGPAAAGTGIPDSVVRAGSSPLKAAEAYAIDWGVVIRVRVRLFAALRERAGAGERALELPEGTTAGDAWAALGLGTEPPGLALAVNRAYAERGTLLADGDELAFIPPVSGGAPRVHVELVQDEIDLAALVARVADPGAGAVTTFSGTVRDRSRGEDVRHLDYEVYPEMAEAELERIARDVAERHALHAIAVVHRSGRCEIGDTTVAIACSSAHRPAALAACAETIDTLKERVPIWKKEHYADGAVWVGQGS